MRQWYKIKAQSPATLVRGKRSLKNGRIFVRDYQNGDGESLVVAVAPAHSGWVTRTVGDLNASLTTMEAPPKGIRIPAKDEYEMPCGEKFQDPIMVTHHVRTCAQCRAKLPKAQPGPKSKNGQVKVTQAFVPGFPETLDGVISALESYKEQLFAKVDDLDKLVQALKNYRGGKESMAKLENDTKVALQAAKNMVLKET